MTIITLISEIRATRPDWTPRKALHEIDKARAVFLKNKINQGRVGIDTAVQVIAGVDMIIVEQSELYGYETSGRILRSVNKLPVPIEYQNLPYKLTVRDPRVLGEPFNLVSADRAPYVGNGRSNVRDVFVFIHNDYLYIKLKRENPRIGLISKVTVQGIFETPTDVIAANNPTFSDRDFWGQEYPLSVADWLYVKGFVLNGETGQGQNES
jgi:hypothetical protein